MDRTLFLWLVSTALVFPAARSHSLIVESWLPVTTYMYNKFNVVVYNQAEGAHVRHIPINNYWGVKSSLRYQTLRRAACPPDLIIKAKIKFRTNPAYM